MSKVALFGQISEINDHLYLSGAGVLRPERLKQKGIQCVINATVEEPMYSSDKIECLRIRIEDSPYARLDHYFDIAADKIRSVKDRGGKTLVHCVAGVSRSATLCIVYLIKYEHMSLRQAYFYVKAARQIIRPNLGFWKQMVEYERKLRGHNTVTLVNIDNCPLPFPDVYSNDLRKHIMTHPEPPQNDPQLIALQKKYVLQQQQQAQNGRNSATKPGATIIPVQIIGKRDSLRNGRTIGSRTPSENGFVKALNSASSVLPWRALALSPFLSPAPSRRSGSSVGGRFATQGSKFGAYRSSADDGSIVGKLYGPSLL